MSDYTVGEINFKEEDLITKAVKEHNKINTIKGTFKVKPNWDNILKGKEEVNLIELIQAIDKKEISSDIGIEDEKGEHWKWDTEDGNFIQTIQMTGGTNFLSENLNDIELINYKVRVIYYNDKNNKDIDYNKALDIIVEEIEDKWIDLEMELDACQGCTENLDVKFKQINIYKNILKFLTNKNPENKRQEIIDRFYKRRKLEEIKLKEEKERKDNILKRTEFPILEWYDIKYDKQENRNELIQQLFIKLFDKTNEIVEIIRSNKNF